MIEWVALGCIIVAFVGTVLFVLITRSKDYVVEQEEQYAWIRQDKEDGMRVNIKPEQK